jgi:hypothetical protein
MLHQRCGLLTQSAVYLRAKQHFSLRIAYTVKHTKTSSRRRLPAAKLSSVAMETGSATKQSASDGISKTDRPTKGETTFPSFFLFFPHVQENCVDAGVGDEGPGENILT